MTYHAQQGLLKKTSEALPELLVDPQVVLWVDFEAATPDELRPLETVFRFHPLAVDQCRRDDAGTPELKTFAEHLFLTLRAAMPTQDEYALPTAALFCFLGPKLLVTVHGDPLRAVSLSREGVLRSPQGLEQGAAFILYDVLDRLADGYQSLAGGIDKTLENLAERLDVPPDPAAYAALNKELSRFARQARDHRDLAARLAEPQAAAIPNAARPFFQNVQARFRRLSEEAEDRRALLALTIQGRLLGEQRHALDTLRVLAAVVMIILPASFILLLARAVLGVAPLGESAGGIVLFAALLATVIGAAVFARWRRWF